MKSSLDRIVRGIFLKKTALDWELAVYFIGQIREYLGYRLKEETLTWAADSLRQMKATSITERQFRELLKTIERANSEDLDCSAIDSTFRYSAKPGEMKALDASGAAIEEIAFAMENVQTMNSVVMSPLAKGSGAAKEAGSFREGQTDDFKSLMSAETSEEAKQAQDFFLDGGEKGPGDSFVLEKRNLFEQRTENLNELREGSKRMDKEFGSKWRAGGLAERPLSRAANDREIERIMSKLEGILKKPAASDSPRRAPSEKAGGGEKCAKEAIKQLSVYESEFNDRMLQFMKSLEDKIEKHGGGGGGEARGPQSSSLLVSRALNFVLASLLVMVLSRLNYSYIPY